MDPLVLQRRFAPLLHPLARLYALAMRIRRSLITPKMPPVPTVSVGNIAWGGTGKTPVTDALLDICSDNGLHACVLTRGYGARPPSLPFVVTPGSAPSDCGDEPLWLAKRHPDALVVVDPERVRGAGKALEYDQKPDIFILDDGFQHVRMGRHLNLLLLRQEDVGLAYDRVIPEGQWREGADTLRYADAFLMKADEDTLTALRPRIEHLLGKYGRPFFRFTLRPQTLRRVGSVDGYFPPGDYVLVSGTGDPKNVLETAKHLLHSSPVRHLVFSDHHAYSQKDADMLAACRLPIVCTGKDADKLAQYRLPLWEMPISVVFGSSLWCEDSFESWFINRLKMLS